MYTLKNYHANTFFGIFFTLCTLLSGCGGSGGHDASQAGNGGAEVQIEGSVGDGPITNATLNIYDKNGALVKTVRSDSYARYVAHISVVDELYPLTIEATGGTDLVTGLAPDFVLLSVVKNSSTTNVNINPYSTLIVGVAKSMPGGLLQPANIDVARDSVLRAMNYGLDTRLFEDPIQTRVTDINVATIVKSSEILGEMLRRTRDHIRVSDPGATLDSVIMAIVSDIVDGSLDGLGIEGVNERISALAILTTAQVLVEAFSNNLNVNGVRVTAALDQSILVTQPAVRSESMTAAVRITGDMIRQAQDALKVAEMLVPSPDLDYLSSRVNFIVADSLPAVIEPFLPASLSNALTQAISITYDLTNERLGDAVRDNKPFVRTDPVNTPPSLSGIPHGIITVGSVYDFQPLASDMDTDSLSFSIENRPGWADFSATSGRLYGMPGVGDIGISDNVVISVTDGVSTISLPAFHIRVNAPRLSNDAPSIVGIPATTITAGAAYDFTPRASDPEGGSLQFSITNKPGWASFSTSTGRLYGNPTNTNVGATGNIVISVSDGNLSASLPAFTLTVDAASLGSGNYDPNFVANPADFLYIDLNRSTNGTGSTPEDPVNVIPAQLGNRKQVFFNADNGVQTIPCRDDAIILAGSNVQVSSYGAGRATISAYQTFSGGWLQVGDSKVWHRSFSGATSGAGPVVGNMIDLSSMRESLSGDVLGWQNLEEEGNKIGVFRANPSVLPRNKYAYDWQNEVMYVNVGGNPNQRTLGISCVGRLLNTPVGGSPMNVAVHNLRIIGFARASINLKGDAANWHIHDNEFYATGGMYNVKSKWYHGSGIQMTNNTNHIEISNNTLLQTYDSPITPQHFGGSANNHLHDLHIHHNIIDKWALGAVEMADFGTNNQYSRITIEDNIAINGGLGFSALGDTPTGITDGFQVRGGSASGVFSDLIIRRNKVNARHANIVIGGSNFTNEILIENNLLWGAAFGIENNRINAARIHAYSNKLCDNRTQIDDAAVNSIYSDNLLIAGACTVN